VRRLVLLLAISSLALAACTDAGSAVVATVNGTEVTLDDVRTLRPDTDAVSTDQFAQDLQLIIVNNIVRDGAEDLGIQVTAEELTAEIDQIIAQITSPNPQTGESISWDDFKVQQNLSDPIVDLAVEQQLLNEELIAYFGDTVEVSDEEIEDRYNIEQQSRSEVCSSHILLEDEETADEVYALTLEEGADFAALAVEYSTGPSGPTGGDLGCTSPSSYVPEFGAATLLAELGVPYGPVQTQFGWHVILVTDRTIPELEDIREELADTVRQQGASGAVTDWFLEQINGAEVTIDAEYGSWEDTGTGAYTVVPPSPQG
jgi:parvulin-like peptidyl-prolyl isomerase